MYHVNAVIAVYNINNATVFRLPRKQDIERKIEIVQFASRTRQLFVRLLALVKWANSASKVEKCAVSIDFHIFIHESSMFHGIF